MKTLLLLVLVALVLHVVYAQGGGQGGTSKGKGQGDGDRPGNGNRNETDSEDGDMGRGMGRRGQGPPGERGRDVERGGRPVDRRRVSKGKGRRARGQRRAADKVKGRGLVLTDDLIMQYKSRDETVEVVFAQFRELNSSGDAISVVNDQVEAETNIENTTIPNSADDDTGAAIQGTTLTSVIVLSNGVIVTMQASIPWSNGTVLLSGETYPVMEGTMKLTLRISNVTWSDGGERICTRLNVAGPDKGEPKSKAKGKRFSLGDTAEMDFDLEVAELPREGAQLSLATWQTLRLQDIELTEEQGYSRAQICFPRQQGEPDDSPLERYYDPTVALMGADVLGDGLDGETYVGAASRLSSVAASLVALLLAYVIL